MPCPNRGCSDQQEFAVLDGTATTTGLALLADWPTTRTSVRSLGGVHVGGGALEDELGPASRACPAG